MTDSEIKKSAIALGNFDGLHTGHAAVINNAVIQKSNGLVPYVLIFDNHPQQILSKKMPKQLLTYSNFQKLTAEMGCEIIKISFNDVKDMSPEEFVKNILIDKLNTKYISCGFNYRFGKNGAGNTETLHTLCQKYNIELCVAEAVICNGATVSSTRIRTEIENGNIEIANEMLGRPFTYDFEVADGDKRGRKMGFPTINQYFPESFIVPKYGVYASQAYVDGEWYYAVTNIGIRPTIGSSKPRSETHIIGFSGNLYSDRIPVALLSHLRDEIRFNSLDELILQIKKDKKKAVAYLEAIR